MTDATLQKQKPEPPTEAPPAAPSAPSLLPSVVVTVVAFVLALIIGAILIIVSSEDVLRGFSNGDIGIAFSTVGHSYWDLVTGAVGSWDNVTTTLERSAPLICAGLGVTLAFRAGLFNIGAQGQLIIASLLSGYIAFHYDMPPVIHAVVALIAALVGGAVWGGIVGFLKARTGAHEVITTMMFNYLAKSVLIYCLSQNAFQRPGRDDHLSPPIPDSAAFPKIVGFHIGVLIALAAGFGVWWLLERSTLGFEMRAAGANPNAARTAGMSLAKVTTLAMLFAGLLAGLAGAMSVLGDRDNLSDNTGGTVGFDAITVALLGRATPLGTVLAGFLFGALSVGGSAMQAGDVGTPKELAQVLQAVIVLFVAAPALVRAIVRMRSGGGREAVMAKGWGG